METDMQALRASASYRARMTETMTKTLAAGMDVEHFYLLVAAACGRKGQVVE
jgi:hypothetical protein